MSPVPPSIFFITRAYASCIPLSTGPAFALCAFVPAAASVWQLPHSALKTIFPAAGLPGLTAPKAGAANASAIAATPTTQHQPSEIFATVGWLSVAA